MIWQIGEDKRRKKRNIPIVNTDRLARNLSPELSADDEIDPADFIDPEEFGIGRHAAKSSRQ
jgi:type III secretory pathway component EscU